MAQPSVVPMAKALWICDGTIGFPNQKTDVMGLFNSISPQQFPYFHPRFVAFAQLSGGLGNVTCNIDVTYAATGQLLHSSNVRVLNFANRDQTIQLAQTIAACSFPQPGIYLVELFCNGKWVADTKLELR